MTSPTPSPSSYSSPSFSHSQFSHSSIPSPSPSSSSNNELSSPSVTFESPPSPTAPPLSPSESSESSSSLSLFPTLFASFLSHPTLSSLSNEHLQDIYSKTRHSLENIIRNIHDKRTQKPPIQCKEKSETKTITEEAQSHSSSHSLEDNFNTNDENPQDNDNHNQIGDNDDSNINNPRPSSSPPLPPSSSSLLSSPSPHSLSRLLDSLESFLSLKLYEKGDERTIFHRYDRSHSGFLSVSLFSAALSSVSILLQPEEISALLSKYNVNNDGNIHYYSLLSVLEAKRTQPKSLANNQFNKNYAHRIPLNNEDTKKILTSASRNESLSVRISRGLELLRDTIHSKKSSPHQFFLSLQNDERLVIIDDIIAKFPKFGFPTHLATYDELRMVAQQYSLRKNGQLSYAEFLSFFLNETSDENPNPTRHPYENPSLLDVLLKIHNIGPRTFYRQIDEDSDGIVTSDQIISHMESLGLPSVMKNDQPFRTYLESFSKRKNGVFTYAEYSSFVNTRRNGQSTKSNGDVQSYEKNLVIIPPHSTVATMLEIIAHHVKTHQISVATVMNQMDMNDDGMLEEREFGDSLRKMGIDIEYNELMELIEVVGIKVKRERENDNDNDHDTHDENNDTDSLISLISISDFSLLLINPSRNPQHLPRTGRDLTRSATIPLGSINADTMEKVPKSGVRMMGNNGSQNSSYQSYEISAQQIPYDSKNPNDDSDPFQPVRRPGSAQKLRHTNDLSHHESPWPIRQPRPHTKDNLEGQHDPHKNRLAVVTSAVPHVRTGLTTQKSHVNFAQDHGYVSPSPPGRDSHLHFLDFNATESKQIGQKLSSRKMIKQPDSIVFAPPLPHNPSYISPTTFSSVSFNQSDVEIYRPLKSVLTSPGGNATIDLQYSMERDDDMVERRKRVNGNITKGTLELTYRENKDNYQEDGSEDHHHGDHPPMYSTSALSSSPSPSTTSPSSSTHRQQHRRYPSSSSTANPSAFSPSSTHTPSDVLSPSFPNPPLSYSGKRHNHDAVGGRQNFHVSSSNPPISPHTQQLLSPTSLSLSSSLSSSDSAVLRDVKNKFHAEFPKLRQVFHQWGKFGSTLSREAMRKGLKGIGVEISDGMMEGWFGRYDGDGDGEITYTEFVKMMSTV